MWKKLVDTYNANGKLHTLVVSVEIGAASFFTSYSGGLPSSKSGWVALAFALGGAVWGSVKGWLRNNVATK